ncbi:MAG TPA: HEAT repeat domain-containing protein, partial [Pirellulales bacterium]|nr:HEAT repeat domain-containing protein [Pirellulales bacterium]
MYLGGAGQRPHHPLGRLEEDMSRKRRRLIARLRSSIPRVRIKAMEQLDTFAFESRLVVDLLFEALEDPDGDVRTEATHVLGMANWPIYEAIPLLIRKLKDPDVRVRSHAAYGLGHLEADRIAAGGTAACNPVTIDALIEAISDRTIGYEAIESLRRIGVAANKAVPALLTALESNYCVIDAAEALGAMGRYARCAVGALCRLLKSSDFGERKAAAKGLAGIGPDAGEAVPALLD